MPRRTPITTRDTLKNVPLPTHASSYTVIPHDTIIVNVLAQLKLKGFTVESELYKSNHAGEIALGMYKLNYKNDPEMGMMLAWVNSYDKSTRFKCAVGGFIRESNSAVIGEDFSWSRKHTGTADQEMVIQVTNQIASANRYYDNLLIVRDAMKKKDVKPSEMAEFMGRAFFMEKLFTSEQLGIVRNEMTKPTFNYESQPDSLWVNYNHMLVALKKAHPKTWMEEHLELHKYVCQEFGIITSGTISHVPNAPIVSTVSTTIPETIEEEVVDKPLTASESKEVTTDLEPDNSIPFLEEGGLTPEEQALIDERMNAFGVKSDQTVDFNLPE